MAGTEFDHARKQLQCRETADSLHPFQPSMEISCWLTHKPMNRQPEFIGFTSTSDYSEEAILCRLRQFIRDYEYAEVVPFVHEFLQKGKFKPTSALIDKCSRVRL